MNNLQIDSLLSGIPNFIGTFSCDKLPKIKKKSFFLCINDDISTGPGTHWYACKIQSPNIYFFDSLGKPPKNKFLKKYLKAYGNRVYYSKRRQQGDTENCGLFSIWFIREMSKGKSFESLIEFLDQITNDDEFIENYISEVYNFYIK